MFDRTNVNQRDGAFRPKRKALERLNEKLAKEKPPRFLHATKGYRPVSEKRSHIAVITHSLRTGQLPFLIPGTMRFVKSELKATADA